VEARFPAGVIEGEDEHARGRVSRGRLGADDGARCQQQAGKSDDSVRDIEHRVFVAGRDGAGQAVSGSAAVAGVASRSASRQPRSVPSARQAWTSTSAGKPKAENTRPTPAA